MYSSLVSASSLRSVSGEILASIGVSAYTLSTVLTRELARTDQIDIVTITSVPLVIGGGISLLLAIPVDGSPRLTGRRGLSYLL